MLVILFQYVLYIDIVFCRLSLFTPQLAVILKQLFLFKTNFQLDQIIFVFSCFYVKFTTYREKLVQNRYFLQLLLNYNESKLHQFLQVWIQERKTCLLSKIALENRKICTFVIFSITNTLVAGRDLRRDAQSAEGRGERPSGGPSEAATRVFRGDSNRSVPISFFLTFLWFFWWSLMMLVSVLQKMSSHKVIKNLIILFNQ